MTTKAATIAHAGLGGFFACSVLTLIGQGRWLFVPFMAFGSIVAFSRAYFGGQDRP